MTNIEINVSKETRMVYLNKYTIGNDGENLQGNLVFKFKDNFVNGTGRLEYAINGTKTYAVLEKGDKQYSIPIKSVLTKNGTITMQLVITEGTGTTNIPIFKSNVFNVYCNKSINADTGETPSGYQTWLDLANTKLNLVDEAIESVENVDINASKTGNTATITITKHDGTTKSVNISDGISATHSWNGTTLTITSASGTSSANLKGEKGATGEAGYTPIKNVDYFDGAKGEDATINGVKTINIVEGDNITISQSGNTLTISSSASGGTSDYEELENIPKINGIEVIGDLDASFYGLATQDDANTAYINAVTEAQNYTDSEITTIWSTLGDSYYTSDEIDSMIGNIDTELTSINTGSGV